ncbi:MAG: cation transporter [Flavobacteriales bacterium]|nr:cation transporter [Flavobacteriales bacterium]
MAHDHHQHSENNIKIAFFINLAFTIIEFVGGIWVNSVAIMSDAVHDLGDSLSLGTSWYLQRKSKQESDRNFTFGYARFSLLGALINSIVLIAGSVIVVYNAVSRLIHPEATDARGMMWFAILGIAVNGFAAWRLTHGKSLNERVLSWHLIEDVLGWVAVLVVSIILQFRDISYLDPVLSLLITLYILWGISRRLKQTLIIFLQGAPEGIDLVALEEQIRAVPHVQSLHHTHIWSLEGEQHVFSTHLKLEGISSFSEIIEVKRNVKSILGRYNLQQYTIETELDNEECRMD